MARLNHGKDCTEPISISKIYETIKARDFLQELWWDLISDIPKKPTYQRIKEMVKSLINDTVKEFSVEPPTEAERVKRRTMLTEISIMTYTVDTVISEVLFKKLQNEFPRIIENMIHDLRREKVPENCVLDGNKNTFPVVAGKPNLRIAKSPKKETSVSPKKSPEKNIIKYENVNNSPVPKRGRPRKLSSEPKTASIVEANSSSVPRRKRGRPSLGLNKTIFNAPATKKSNSPLSPSSKDNKESKISLNHIKHEIDEDIDKDSDDESEISVGNFSFDTLSSVHTSELSSFEDVISIGSGDEDDRPKRLVPLRDANEMYVKGKLSQIYEIEKKAEKIKTASKLDISSRQKYSPSTDSPASRKLLPQRIRKPNSKYNSETMYCDIKNYSTPQSSTPANHLKSTSPLQSPEKQKKRRISLNNVKSENLLSSPSKPGKSVAQSQGS